MDQDSTALSQTRSREIWNQARRRVFWERLSATLGLNRQPTTLLSFDEVQQKLRLHQSAYDGLQQVPVYQIVGSVGRYHDFSRTFLPLVESDSARWQRVAELQIESGLPPIELYKVGDAYFVKDGNHRVSVARQLGMPTIEAYVWEYQTPTGGISAQGDVDELIVKAEYRAFLDRTRLDVIRPESEFILTEPGMYPALELEIELYRENLERIDKEPRSYQDAAAAWYDLVYSLAVEIIRDSDALKHFPGRTEADLYVWVARHRKELSERYGRSISLRDAVAQITEQQQRPGPVERVVQSAARLVQTLSPDRPVDEAESFIVPPPESEPLGKLLAQMGSTSHTMAYQGQRGNDWRAWRHELRQKVIDLLGMAITSTPNIVIEEQRTDLISGVKRTRLLLEAPDGVMLPAYLMHPVDIDKPLPGLLIYPGHGTIAQTAGIENSAHRSNALALAQAGFVTLTFEMRGMGELGQVDHGSLDAIARLMGRSWLGITLQDGFRALDYLQSLPEVMPDHIGVAGFGLGGGLALYTAALDERVRVSVVQSFLGGGIDPLNTNIHGCDFIPGLWQYAHVADVARLIAPRPVLYVYPNGRATTRVAQAWFNRTRPMYEIFSCPDRTNFVLMNDGARFYRVVTRNWFDRWLSEEHDTSVLLWAPRE